MNEIVVNKIICDVINGKLKYEENSDAFSEIENKRIANKYLDIKIIKNY